MSTPPRPPQVPGRGGRSSLKRSCRDRTKLNPYLSPMSNFHVPFSASSTISLVADSLHLASFRCLVSERSALVDVCISRFSEMVINQHRQGREHMVILKPMLQESSKHLLPSMPAAFSAATDSNRHKTWDCSSA